MAKIRVGLDIGSKGAYAIFINDQLNSYGRMPYSGDDLDMGKLVEILTNASSDQENNFHFLMEDLHSVFGSSASSNFSFGVNNGLVIGMLQVMGAPWSKIGPKKWQKQIWEGIRPVEVLVKGKTNKDGSPKYKVDTKATSLTAASRLFPKEKFLPTERSKVPDDNIVDAVLIGLYCTRNF